VLPGKQDGETPVPPVTLVLPAVVHWQPRLLLRRLCDGDGRERLRRSLGRRCDKRVRAVAAASGAEVFLGAAAQAFGFAACTGGFGVTSGRRAERDANTPR